MLLHCSTVHMHRHLPCLNAATCIPLRSLLLLLLLFTGLCSTQHAALFPQLPHPAAVTSPPPAAVVLQARGAEGAGSPGPVAAAGAAVHGAAEPEGTFGLEVVQASQVQGPPGSGAHQGVVLQVHALGIWQDQCDKWCCEVVDSAEEQPGCG
jgi:hypothetical protein